MFYLFVGSNDQKFEYFFIQNQVAILKAIIWNAWILNFFVILFIKAFSYKMITEKSFFKELKFQLLQLHHHLYSYFWRKKNVNNKLLIYLLQEIAMYALVSRGVCWSVAIIEQTLPNLQSWYWCRYERCLKPAFLSVGYCYCLVYFVLKRHILMTSDNIKAE